MSLNRYNPKRDANEGVIIDALRAHGASVERLNTPVDLVIGYLGRTYLAEVKVEGAKLNKRQREFVDGWKGGKVEVFRTAEDVMEFVEEIKAGCHR